MSKTIVLTGPAGSGKSTVGRLLAHDLGREFIDTDEVIVTEARRSIPAIFAESGENEFRRLEAAAVQASVGHATVTSLGGGAVITPAVRDSISEHIVIWLRVNAETAMARVGTDQTRPLLASDRERQWVRLANEREPFYDQVATINVDTTELSPREVVDEILEALDDYALD